MYKEVDRKLSRILFLGIICVLLLLVLCNSKNSEAAGKYVSSMAWDSPIQAGNAVFVAKQQKVGSQYMSKIVIKVNGKSRTLVSKTDAAFVTNGRILYYSKPIKKLNDFVWKKTIFCHNIRTGKSTKVISGKNYIVTGCSGKYIYFGVDNEADGIKLYALNLKSKKKKYMIDHVGIVTVLKEKVITMINTGDMSNVPIHAFNLNGSGKKKIAEGCYVVYKKGKLYYAKCNAQRSKYKIYSCSLDGKNKFAETGWLDQIPSKYL